MKLHFHPTSGGGDGKVVPPGILYDFDADDYQTTADLTAGQQLDTSGWIVGSGTWAIRDVSGKKWIEARTSKFSQYVYYPINQNSYGSWIYTMLKITDAECQFAINDRPGMPWATANSNGYWIQNGPGNIIYFRKTIAGVTSVQLSTVANYIENNNQYRVCLTRDNNGVSTLYVLGGSYTVWTKVIPSSGSNPVTINDVNPTQYLCLHGNYTGTRFSDIIHIDQVINPTITPELIPNI